MNNIPKHIAVVPNGNRRKSTLLGLSLSKMYTRCAEHVLEFVGWAKAAEVKHVSIFGLSCENLDNRPRWQIDALMRGADYGLDHFKDMGKLHAFGDIDKLGEVGYVDLHRRLLAAQSTTWSESDFVIHVAANYSGKPEHELAPMFAALRADTSVEDVQRDLLDKYLLSAKVPSVDLFIRTGGEKRTSGLLPFQSIYAELYFVDCLWVDFTQQMFDDALSCFGTQQRNFGK